MTMQRIDHSKGRWWDRSWTLVDGCTWPGGQMPSACENCWARAMARRFNLSALGRVCSRAENLDLPLRVSRPTVWACQINYGDLLHPDVPTWYIRSALRIISRCEDEQPGHQFALLTKRPEYIQQVWDWTQYPLRHLIVLASVWDQASTDRAIGELSDLPSQRWGLHMEPLLGPVDLRLGEYCRAWPRPAWIAVGAENGPGARPCSVEWVRSIRDQCMAAGVPFYLKGLGGRVRVLDGRTHDEVWYERSVP